MSDRRGGTSAFKTTGVAEEVPSKQSFTSSPETWFSADKEPE
ncbi:hypothetical protein [Nostoc sp.]